VTAEVVRGHWKAWSGSMIPAYIFHAGTGALGLWLVAKAVGL
jgi:hypothetical protein